jgi:hypothetical protein
MKRETYRKMKEMGLDQLVSHLVYHGISVNDLATIKGKIILESYLSSIGLLSKNRKRNVYLNKRAFQVG